MDPLPYITTAVCYLKSLEVDGVHHIPARGPVLIVTAHDSPLDVLYHLALMRPTGRRDHRFVMAADMLDPERFRHFTRKSIRQDVAGAALLAGAVARLGSWMIPPLMRPLNPIPIYRQGDDSDSRKESLSCLLAGGAVTIAPERGNNNDRDADGQRPLTHGVAAIARRYFEITGEPLAIIPVGMAKRRNGWLEQVSLRVGAPLRTMSAAHYPDLFSSGGPADLAVKHRAYQHFTQELAGHLSALSA